MLEVTKLININQDLINVFKLQPDDSVYELKGNNDILGYGIVHEDEENKIEIYLLNNYQSQGYGTFLFQKIISELKKQVIIKVPNHNIRMQKIVKKFNGVEIGKKDKDIFYLIPVFEEK